MRHCHRCGTAVDAPTCPNCGLLTSLNRSDRTDLIAKAALSVVAAMELYDAECMRVFGALPLPTGRAGRELHHLLRTCEVLKTVLDGAMDDVEIGRILAGRPGIVIALEPVREDVVESEALRIVRAIIDASDGCQGHAECNHSMQAWKDARRLLGIVDAASGLPPFLATLSREQLAMLADEAHEVGDTITKDAVALELDRRTNTAGEQDATQAGAFKVPRDGF